MKLECPHCGAGGTAEDSLAGCQVTCPKCREKFVARQPAPFFEEAVERPRSSEREGIADNGLEEMTVGGILKESWQLSRNKRFSAVCWVGVLTLIACMAILSLVLDGESGLIISTLRRLGSPVALLSLVSAVATVISIGLGGNLEVGLPYLGIRHRMGKRVGLKTCFRGFSASCFKRVFLASILKAMITMIGFLCMVLPGLYLTLAYWFALPLIVDRNLAPWEALEMSRRAVTKAWMTMFGVYISIGLLPLLVPGILCSSKLFALLKRIEQEKAGELPLAELYSMFQSDFLSVGALALVTLLIWFLLLPWFFASYGVLYRKIFRFEEKPNINKEGVL